MGVSVSVLASGSRGNSTIVQSSSTRILVDAGISCRETFKRMKAAGDDPGAQETANKLRAIWHSADAIPTELQVAR